MRLTLSAQLSYAPVADVLRAGAPAVWAGGLLVLAAVLTIVRGCPLGPAARRLSTIALAAVLVVAAIGLVRAFTELSSVDGLWTRYGFALLVQSGVLAVLVALGYVNRRPRRRPVLLGEIAGLAVLLVAAGALTGSHPGLRQPLAASGPIALPPSDVLALAAQDVRRAITIAVQPAGTQTEVTVGVLGPDGLAVNGLPVRVNGLRTVACGRGCYRAVLPGRPVDARVDAGTGTVVFPLHTTTGPAAELVETAARKLSAATSTVYLDRLSSGPGHTIVTLWKEQAPDRVSYVIDDGVAGIAIGGRRWDRFSRGARWVVSPQTPLEIPALPWLGPLTNFQILAADSAGWTVAFMDRSTPAWFRARIDRRTGRLRSFSMIAASHFMNDEYLSYDGKVVIRPPR